MMELHPYFERGSTSPKSNLWYVLATEGDSPSMRVGSTATFVSGKTDAEEGRLFVIGGANPDGTFAEINLLDLTTMAWDRLDTPSHISRYEHAVSLRHRVNAESSTSIIVFGGAVQTGNLNDLQQYSLNDERWSTITSNGTSPSARTQHSMSAFFSDGRLVVYGGGHAGAEPVNDQKIYIFDPSTSTWSNPKTSGQSPKARHGHLILTYGNQNAENSEKIYVHGGMTGNTFFDDLFVLDLAKNEWNELRAGRERPCGRAAHGGVVWKQKLYIFGGMCRSGALDDMWSFDTGTEEWTEIKYNGPPPPSRLDFACCLISLRGRDDYDEIQVPRGAADVKEATVNGTKEPTADDGGSNEAAESSVAMSVSTTRLPVPTTGKERADKAQTEQSSAPTERCVYFIVLGGMDTQGTIFDDTLMFLIDREPLGGQAALDCGSVDVESKS